MHTVMMRREAATIHVPRVRDCDAMAGLYDSYIGYTVIFLLAYKVLDTESGKLNI